MGCRAALLPVLLGLIACNSDPDPASGALTGTAGTGTPSGAGTGPIPTPPAAAGTGTSAGAGRSSPTPAAAGTGSAGRSSGAAGMTPAPAGTGAAAGGPAAGSPAAGSGGTGGRAGRGGGAGSAAGSGGRGAAGATAGSGGAAAGSGSPTGEKFSFFVTSLGGMLELSKNPQGFGGNLKFGEATGLAGADKICATLAEKSMPGAGAKTWRAFLSTAKGGSDGGPTHARERIGQGPWFDRNGRMVASSLSALTQNRPMDADPAIRDDLPNEEGVPNHTDTMAGMDDNHDTVTASNAMGMYDNSNTCGDWTSTETPSGQKGPTVGHSWPSQQSGVSWIKAHPSPGCAPSVALVQTGAGMGTGIGNSGGYGGFYCFALQP